MTSRNRHAHGARRRDGQGQVLVLFALMLVVLLLVSALAVDYGGWLVLKRNHQNISDAAALAGAQHLTRPLGVACASGPSKNQCAREAAWESVKEALNLPALNPAAQAAGASNVAYVENGYSMWVASPPIEANVGCTQACPYPGHVSGPGVVFVRVDHAAPVYLARIAGIGRTVSAWATAGRFPANFALIAMCSPNSVTERCLAGDGNIKLDGSNTNLIIETGDLGSNRWTKTGGSTSGVALGVDSNAYMQLHDKCWEHSTNQCQLWNFTGGAIDYTIVRSAIPLGAPIQDPNYDPPPINATTAPWQCRGTGSVTLAAAPADDGLTAVEDLPINLAAHVVPNPAPWVANLVQTDNDMQGLVKDSSGNLLGGISVTATESLGTPTYNLGDTPASGGYLQNDVDSGTYTITATDSTGTYHTTSVTLDIPPESTNATYTAPDIVMPEKPTISGTISSISGGTISGATITITGAGGPYATTSGAGGAYGPVRITGWGPTNTWDVNVSAPDYVPNTVNSGFLALEADADIDVSLTPAPGTLTGTITDVVTGLSIPNVTVTLSSGPSTTTDLSGVYSFAAVTPGSTTITLSNIDGYMNGSPSSPPNPTTQTINTGPNTVNFALWPKGCNDTGDIGDWRCDEPAGADNCPAVTNIDGANVTCAFTQANAIRPGTYDNIAIENGCAWLDPRGGATGLAPGQSAGIYHITGSVFIGPDSYLFGDGVTMVFDRLTNIDVGNGGGFVLNYGSVANGSPLACDLSTVKKYADGQTPCFRTVPTVDGEDYAYAAWTTEGHAPWSSATFPVYDDAVVDVGQEIGITFFFYGSGLGNRSRMKINTANMGYLFNGVLYGPNDDIELGGGKNGQTAAGQIVGWTIEYHGGTQIAQNWYGDPVDGKPFLIEPILGQ